MKKINFGQSLTILANIGVILGIVFLAIEVRNSANQASNQALQSTVTQFIDWHKQIAADPELAQIYSEGRKDYNRLSELDQQRFDALMRALVSSVTLFIDSRAQLFDTDIPPLCERTAEGYILESLDQPGFRQWLSVADRRTIPGQLFPLLEHLEQNCGHDASDDE